MSHSISGSTAGSIADCTQAVGLIEGIEAEHLIADKGHGANAILAYAKAHNMAVQIPPKSNRREPRKHDKHLYKTRHLVENAFAKLKTWRGIATRYAKRTASCLAFVQFHCILLWAKIS